MSFPRLELIERTSRLRNRMKVDGFDALVIFSDEYRSGHGTYLTNYKPINVIEESPQSIFMVEDLPPVALIGRLNYFAAKDMIWMDDVRQIHKLDEHVEDILSPIGDRRRRVGLVGENLLPGKYFDVIQAALPKAEFLPVSHLLIGLRQSKSEAEIELMQKTATIDDTVLREVFKKFRIGLTKTQIAAEAEYIGRSMGEDLGLATVVMSGPNTKYPA